MMKKFALIFARGGSKGVKGKNTKSINGQPLISWSINIAKELGIFDSIFVSTECSVIASVAMQYGAEVIDRPSKLATDTAPELLAWKHAVQYLLNEGVARDEDLFVSLPATSPLRKKADVLGCIDTYLKNNFDLVLAGTPSKRSPYFNMFSRNSDQSISLVNAGEYTRRQDVPDVYDATTVCYVTRFSNVMTIQSVLDGSVGMYDVCELSSIDIDTEIDFRLAEILMEDYYAK